MCTFGRFQCRTHLVKHVYFKPMAFSTEICWILRQMNAASFQPKIFWKTRFSMYSLLVPNSFLFLSSEFFHHFIERDKKTKTISYILLFICLTSLESIRRTVLGYEPDSKTVFSSNGSNYCIPILWGRNWFMPFLWILMKSECKLLQPAFELYLLILFSLPLNVMDLTPHILTIIFPVLEI